METRLSILFYGKKAKLTKEGLTPIYLRSQLVERDSRPAPIVMYYLPGGPLRLTGLSSSAEARSINVFLDSLLNKVYSYHQEIINEAKPITIENFAKKWFGKKEKPVMLFEIFEQHNQKITDLVGNGYAPATISKYKTTLDYCRQFVEWKYNVKDRAGIA